MAFDMIQPEYLFRLARSGSSDDRKILAQSVIGFVRGDLNTNERQIAEEILLRLLQEAEADIRMALADQLAHEPNCPKVLIDFLVYENPYDIAESILQFSEVLSDDDLIEIIQKFEDTRYWQSIARRKEVGEHITRYLIGTNDKDVHRILVKNRGAEFCPISIEWMVQIAAKLPDIQAPLLGRPEVTPELAAKLYWHVSSELRSVITSRFDINIKQIDALLNKLVKHRLAKRQPDVGITDDDLVQALYMKKNIGITSHQLLEALQKDKVGLFCCLWAQMLNLDPCIVQQKLQEDASEGLAVLCHATQITVRHYNVLFLLWRRNERYARPTTNLTDALELYNSMTLQQAQQRLASWNSQEVAAKTLH